MESRAEPQRGQTDRQTDRQFGRKAHSEQLGCCATHLRRYRTQPPCIAPCIAPCITCCTTCCFTPGMSTAVARCKTTRRCGAPRTRLQPPTYTVAASLAYGCSLPRIRLQPRMRAVAGPAVGVAVPAVVEHQLRLHVLRHTALPSHTRSAGGAPPRRRPAPAAAPTPTLRSLCVRSAPALRPLWTRRAHSYCAPPTTPSRHLATRERAPRHTRSAGGDLPRRRPAPALHPHPHPLCTRAAPTPTLRPLCRLTAPTRGTSAPTLQPRCALTAPLTVSLPLRQTDRQRIPLRPSQHLRTQPAS